MVNESAQRSGGEGTPRPGTRPETLRLLLLASFVAGLLAAWIAN